jgi:hypothetical protein
MIAGLVFFGAYVVVAFEILAAGAEVQSAASPPVKESLQRSVSPATSWSRSHHLAAADPNGRI